MISKLPRWVWLGAWLLAFIAGMINVVALIGFEHQGVSHLTATTSRLGAAWVMGDYHSLAQLAALIGSFLAGATISGWLIRDSVLKLGRRYGAALMLESILLFSSILFLRHHGVVGVYFASCACGLQNAMASTYSGAVVRTTHVTGMFTDIGIILGHRLRGLPADWKRLHLNTLIILGFITGGMSGAFLFRVMDYATLLLPAAGTGAAAIAYEVYLRRKRASPAVALVASATIPAKQIDPALSE